MSLIYEFFQMIVTYFLDTMWTNHIVVTQCTMETNQLNGYNNNSPLDQFVIVVLLTLALPFVKLCITNMGLYLGITTIIVVATGLLALNNSKTIANYWSICVESLHATIHNIVVSQINNKTGQSYYPFMYSLFMLILISNLIGMIPYCLASTSHFSFSFSLSFSIVLGCTILGFFLHKLVFFSLLVPEGCPLGLLFLLVLIEFISYLARAVSLGLRLAANILSGHMLLNILSSFTYKIMKQGSTQSVASILPSVFVTAFTVLEIGICFIQAQVYVVLSSSYISNAIRLH